MSFQEPAYQKFESGKATPKYENMEFLLRQINMSFEEFDYNLPPLSTEPTNRNHANLSQYELNPRD